MFQIRLTLVLTAVLNYILSCVVYIMLFTRNSSYCCSCRAS